ncbi:MAG: ABC transporter ATP-binding protein [Candidatus Kerfeldbacteria bacterium]|nr:ABC transporter ATP-binding protein [Candidatus Kerfeldbacteria bacterium]
MIEVNNISKSYVLAHQLAYQTFRDTVTNFATKPFRFFQGQLKMTKEEFWALRDITFSVEKGEAVGLIGANGSGKSTLLKILSHITSPTTGEVRLRGRVASLLEVGTGFHPELTGRENIYLNGAILGMSRNEINRKFDEIVAFSGVEKFLDTPVKRYSSGMHVRLAFSVAAHLEPEILLVDEVLAVGDAEFQKKCLGKMNQVTRDADRTVIFVSHNLEAIKKLCHKCILLKEGRLVMFGQTSQVIEKYLHKDNQPSSISLQDRKDRDGKGGVTFTDIHITNQDGAPVITSGDILNIRLRYTSELTEKIKDVRVVITIVNDDLRPVLRLDSDVTGQSFSGDLAPQGEIECTTGEVHLTEGRYFAEIDFLIRGTSRDHVLMASEFTMATHLPDYQYKIKPDRTITNNLLRYSFKQ